MIASCKGLFVEEISEDILMEEFWKFLPLSTLMGYCGMNKMLYSILESDETWRYLIWRDFRIKFGGNDAKEEYKRFHTFDETFSYESRYTFTQTKFKLKLNKPLKKYNYDELGIISTILGGPSDAKKKNMMVYIVEYYAKRFKRSHINWKHGFGKSLAFYLSE